MRLRLLAVVWLSACGGELEPELDEEPGDVAVNEAQALANPPLCGTALASYDGTTAFSNGRFTGRGQSCGGVGPSGLRYQCVELVMRHALSHWGFRWWGNAKDLLRNAPPAKVDVRLNGDLQHPVVPGDFVVWTRGTYGHVALVTAVRAGAVDLIEQNWGPGKLTLAYVNGKLAGRPDAPAWVPAGWAHVKANVPSEPLWNCAWSAWGNAQLWTCDRDGLPMRHRCSAGQPEHERCATACVVMPLGTPDVCR